MNRSEGKTDLSQISTLWTLVRQAHASDPAAARDAQDQLLRRYQPAMKGFLITILKDAAVAEDIFQEFALRFVSGQFRGVDPQCGRFRDYAKQTLRHLVIDHHRRRQRERHVPLPDDSRAHPAADLDIDSLDRAFDDEWRKELLERAWKTLKELEQQADNLFYTILRLRTRNPKVPIADLAQRISRETGRPMTADNFRKILQRARQKLAESLVAEVTQSLTDTTTERIQEELGDLGLLKYCASVFDKDAQ